MPKLKEEIGLSTSTIYQMMLEGTFPRPIKLGKRAVGWHPEDIKKWIRDRQEQSNA